MDKNRIPSAPAPPDPELRRAVLSQLLSSPAGDAIFDLETAREL